VNQIALVSPSATINRIKNKKVISKHKVELPAKLNIIGKCPNISCITNYESASETSFDLEHKEYRCIYCERTFKPFELIK
jgi:aspartate carbamoyltransferase regulatory subunit